jgi:protein phosphatase
VTGHEQIEHASITDVGIRRSHNQDSHAVLLATDVEQWNAHGHVFLVADGMGGHAVGELASELAAGIIPHTYQKHAGEGPEVALRKAFIEANASIHARGQQNREFEGMGTTSTALLLRPEGAWVAHVGDSRAYRIREGRIDQLSFDHSLIWEMARRQKVDPSALQGVRNNIIVRSLGPDAMVQVDVEGPHPLQVGDRFVLCSDGLSGQLSDHEIGTIASVMPPAEACRFLVNLANLRGGPDNITVVIVHVGQLPSVPGPAAPDEPTQPQRFYQQIPWPLIVLFLGVVLAGFAALLAVRQMGMGVFIFTLAAAYLVTGVVGLAILYLRDRRQQEAEATTDGRHLNIHHQATCRIDKQLLEKMVSFEAHLKRLAQERNWEVDWPDHIKHHDLAAELLKKGDLEGAFRESCRAMRPFTEAYQLSHYKDEEFHPVWDRAE